MIYEDVLISNPRRNPNVLHGKFQSLSQQNIMWLFLLFELMRSVILKAFILSSKSKIKKICHNNYLYSCCSVYMARDIFFSLIADSEEFFLFNLGNKMDGRLVQL